MLRLHCPLPALLVQSLGNGTNVVSNERRDAPLENAPNYRGQRNMLPRESRRLSLT